MHTHTHTRQWNVKFKQGCFGLDSLFGFLDLFVITQPGVISRVPASITMIYVRQQGVFSSPDIGGINKSKE